MTTRICRSEAQAQRELTRKPCDKPTTHVANPGYEALARDKLAQLSRRPFRMFGWLRRGR